MTTQELKIILSEVHNGNNFFLLSTLCRLPSSLANYLDLLSLNLDKAIEGNLPIFLLGDFIVNILWNQCTKLKQILKKLNLHNFITCLINFTTPEDTWIDLLIPNNRALVNDTFVTPPPHPPIVARIQLLVQTLNLVHTNYAYKREVFDYSKAENMNLNNDLTNINWDLEVFDLLDIDELYSKFTYNLI